MGDVIRAYTKLVQQVLPDSYGAYPPAANFCNVGDFGTIHNGRFTYEGNLSAFAPNIQYTPIASAAEKTINHASKDYITLQWKLSGGAKVPVPDLGGLGDIQAGIDFVFESDDDIVLVCDDITQNEIDAEPAVFFKNIQKTLKAAGWKDEWVIVSNNWVAANFVFVSASQKKAAFSLTGTASGLFEFGEGQVTEQFAIEDAQGVLDQQTGYANPSTIAFGYYQY